MGLEFTENRGRCTVRGRCSSKLRQKEQGQSGCGREVSLCLLSPCGRHVCSKQGHVPGLEGPRRAWTRASIPVTLGGTLVKCPCLSCFRTPVCDCGHACVARSRCRACDLQWARLDPDLSGPGCGAPRSGLLSDDMNESFTACLPGAQRSFREVQSPLAHRTCT